MNPTQKNKIEQEPSAKPKEFPGAPLGEGISKKRFRFSISEKIFRFTEKLRASGMREARSIDLGELHDIVLTLRRYMVIFPDEKKEIAAEISPLIKALFKAAAEKCLPLVHKVPYHPTGFGTIETSKSVNLKAALEEILVALELED